MASRRFPQLVSSVVFIGGLSLWIVSSHEIDHSFGAAILKWGTLFLAVVVAIVAIRLVRDASPSGWTMRNIFTVFLCLVVGLWAAMFSTGCLVNKSTLSEKHSNEAWKISSKNYYTDRGGRPSRYFFVIQATDRNERLITTKEMWDSAKEGDILEVTTATGLLRMPYVLEHRLIQKTSFAPKVSGDDPISAKFG